MRLETNDGNGGTFEEVFSISINDLPASVTSLDLSNQSINENEISGALVGTFSTTGEDLSGSFTYTFAAGAGDSDNTFFSIAGAQLQTLVSFDFESKNSYSVRVQTSDGGGNTLEEMFTISVNDVSEAPTDLVLSANSLAENNSIDDVIATLSTTDEDAGENYSYSLVVGTGDTDNASFSISGDQLRAGEVFDFEIKNTYSVRLETNDGNGGDFQKAFTITITNENESILVAIPLADQNLNEGFVTLNVDLSGTFIDQDGDALTYSAASSNTNVATVAVSGSTLTLTEAGFGSSTITVTADDGSGVTTSDEFDVIVLEVFSTETDILSFILTEQTGLATINTTLHTVDVEVARGTDMTALNPMITISNGASITPTGSQNFANSSVTYTVTAEDGLTTQDWVVIVNETPNNPPAVTSSISDQIEDEGFGSIQVDLSSTFSDSDGDVLTLSASSSDEAVVTVSISGTILTISEAGIGLATITVSANDGNGGLVSDEFTVTVNAVVVNNPPIVTSSVSDITEDEGFGSIQADLSSTFSDSDGDVLTLSASSSDEAVVTVSISGTILTISEAGIGLATITVTADDGNGGSVSDEFTVTVNAAVVNNPPIVTSSLGDITEVEGFGNIEIDLGSTFSDADGDVLTLSASSSDEAVVTVSISGTILTMSEGGIGSVIVTVTADDGNGGSVSDEFAVTIEEEVITSVKDELVGTVNIYPNPAAEYLTIEIPENMQLNLDIFSPNGQIINRYGKLMSAKTIDVYDWHRGVYYLRLSNENFTTTTRVLIE
ncbi:MAG: T9SS type A sorting domain-containing protein [Bacteroidetes bacterium]|nr:T9SS type A sorting domain-containing protein [Bacteroidota bacterium]